MDYKRHIMMFVSYKDVESFLRGTSDLNDPPNKIQKELN